MKPSLYYASITLLLICASFSISSFTGGNDEKFSKKLQQYCATLPAEFNQISSERQEALRQIGSYIVQTGKEGKAVNLLFVCTHNSRRSQMAQVWAKAAAYYYGVPKVETFSGGLEVTAFNQRAIDALKRVGIGVRVGFEMKETKGPNTRSLVSIGKGYPEMLMYSKRYDDAINPKDNFCAVMVCSDADESCPIVRGATERVSLPYEDPKHYDDTPSEAAKYNERCRQIAREMFFLLDHVKQQQVLAIEKSK